ncbi:MAG: hypothetical protein PWQ77_1393 [Kosmotogales bacterium]|nr:hypothetical protein [Kosmotogales bacterium]
MNRVSYCGLLCSECEIYKASIENDSALKEKLAKEFDSEDFHLEKKDILCFGCSGNEEEIFKFCDVCEIRKCGIKREIVNCGQCEEYYCELLNKPFQMNPENKKILDKINKEK